MCPWLLYIFSFLLKHLDITPSLLTDQLILNMHVFFLNSEILAFWGYMIKFCTWRWCLSRICIVIKTYWMPVTTYSRNRARLWVKNKRTLPCKKLEASKNKATYNNLKRMHSYTDDEYRYWYDQSEEKFVKCIKSLENIYKTCFSNYTFYILEISKLITNKVFLV